jgi:KRAB domain-containing zinc finger protein
MKKSHTGKSGSGVRRPRRSADDPHVLKPVPETPEPRNCLLCEKVCRSQFALQLHMKEHINTTKCVRCNRTFSRAADLRRHVKTHLGEAEFMCTCCGGTMPDEVQLHSHMAAIHGIWEIYACHQCAHKSYSRMAHHSHMNKHKEKPMKYGCSVCEKRFTSKWHAQHHLLQHGGEKPFSCSICHKTFAWKYSLKVHMRAHSDDLRFQCQSCGRKFLLKAHLEHHMNIHTGKKPFKCRYCPKGFSFPSSLQSHERKHFNSKPYQCLLCKSSFVNYASIAYHMRRQHALGMSRLNYVLHTSPGTFEEDMLVEGMPKMFVSEVDDEPGRQC